MTFPASVALLHDRGFLLVQRGFRGLSFARTADCSVWTRAISLSISTTERLFSNTLLISSSSGVAGSAKPGKIVSQIASAKRRMPQSGGVSFLARRAPLSLKKVTAKAAVLLVCGHAAVDFFWHALLYALQFYYIWNREFCPWVGRWRFEMERMNRLLANIKKQIAQSQLKGRPSLLQQERAEESCMPFRDYMGLVYMTRKRAIIVQEKCVSANPAISIQAHRSAPSWGRSWLAMSPRW